MKAFFRFIALFLIGTVAIGVAEISAKGKRYSIDQIRIQAEVLADGSLRIVEDRSYRFWGSFRWADYSLPLKKLGRVTDFELSENQERYLPAADQSPGSYQISQDNERFYVKWFYRAKDEKRTFRLSYRVTDAVTVYDDVAEFYYKFVSERNEQSIGAVEVTAKLPEPADTSQVRAWAHGPLHGQLVFENGEIRLWAMPLPAGTYWEVRCIFPREWVPAAEKRTEARARERIMAEERLLAEQANALRAKQQQRAAFRAKYQGQAMELSIILALAGVLALVAIYHRSGRPYAVRRSGRYSSEIPRDLPPAVASYVYYSGQINSGAMVATLLDLARRGFLSLEEFVQPKQSLFGKAQRINYRVHLNQEFFDQHRDELAAHERDMVEFLFEELAGGAHQIDFAAIRDARGKVMRWFAPWKGVIKQAWGDWPLYDRASVKATVLAALIALGILAAGIVIAALFGVPGAIATITGILLIPLSFAVLRYTPEVKQLRTKLDELKSYLSRYHFKMDLAQMLGSLEQYVVYGIALGIGKKALQEMLSAVPSGQSGGYFAWYAAAASHGSPGSFATAVSTMISAMSATMSSAAGVGGGAAAGGGAGAGGASGGAG
ncbi:MAG: DUF2207 domain-containing protein [candidate division KSB1 bacterium]|nr:DUF2207 domain-containing protein [candidate division KSB1 bacterium]